MHSKLRFKICSICLVILGEQESFWNYKGFSIIFLKILDAESENIYIDLVTVFDAILTSRQTREKLQCLYENLISNNCRKTAVLKNMNCKLKFHS